MRFPSVPSVALPIALSLTGAACLPAHPAAPPLPAPTPAPMAAAPVDPPLPLNPAIETGTLPNGLTYYVLAHKVPAHRAQLWLAVNAGSVLEDDDQRGLAHFVEHMGFNGTRRFPKQALVDFLEKSGVQFGADLNASTGFDQTVYTLQVPTDRPELVTSGLGILRDWSDGVTFDPVEVEKERGVVLEEWRLGRGAGKRLLDKQAPVVFAGSRYAERSPIGKPEIIQGASRDAIVRFYKDWYRPDLMAVIAVGDFDDKAMVAQIRSEFASLAPATSPRPRPEAVVLPHPDPLVSIETDPEATSTRVSVMTEMPHRPDATRADYRRMLGERLYDTMLNARLDEIRRMPDAPFVSAGSGSGALVRTLDAFTQSATVTEDGVRAGLGSLLEEVLRVERGGFTATELSRAKANTLRAYARLVMEYPKSNGRALASEIVRNFLQKEAMPGPVVEHQLIVELLPTFTLEELNGLGKELDKGSRVITVTGPATMTPVTAADLLATTKSVEARDIAPYQDAVPTAPLIASPPAPGSVVATRTIPELSVTEWTLSNGARVVVKPTNIKNDEVLMTSFAPGGTSLAPDADYVSAEFAATVTSQAGLGALDPVALRKMLAGKVVSERPNIGELEQGISASGSPADLETMMQLVYLAYTSPRRDESTFRSWKARELEEAKDRLLSPEAAFRDEMLVFSMRNHPRRQPTTPAVIDRVDLDKAMSFYRDRFADASAFTFVLVGNLSLERTKSLVETYLASLPASHRNETYKDVDARWVPGVAKKEVARGTEPKSLVSLTFHGDEKWSRDAQNDMQMLGEVLRIRLREVLREDMGGVYGVSVGGAVTRRPRQQYRFSIAFGCAPENVAKLEAAVWAEIQEIQDKGIGDDYVAKVKEMRRRAHQTATSENAYWLRELSSAYAFGDDPKGILDFDSFVDKVGSDRVKAAAKKYLAKTQYVLGELRPAASGGATAGP